MRYNPIDSVYKKAIELEGVVANIGNISNKVLIRESNNNRTYGTDYKKIISSSAINQGDYVFVNGVQYLICDIDEQMSQSIYNVGTFRKTLPILLGSNYKSVQGIVDRNKVSIVSTQGIQAEYDQYTFIIPNLGNKVKLNDEIVWDSGIYKVISVDTTKEGLLYVVGEYKDIYSPHIYTITLNETSKTIVETETYTIIPTCKDNNILVENPKVTYMSSDETIATVSENGVVSALKEGNCEITTTYKNVSAKFNLIVEAKPSEPVISYASSWSNNNGVLLRLMSSTTVTCVKTIDGIDDPSLEVKYELDETGKTLLSGKKISITKLSDKSFTIKNTNMNSVAYINITLTDVLDGTEIEVKKIKLQGV